METFSSKSALITLFQFSSAVYSRISFPHISAFLVLSRVLHPFVKPPSPTSPMQSSLMHHACLCSLMHSSSFTVTLSNLHHWLLSALQLFSCWNASASAALSRSLTPSLLLSFILPSPQLIISSLVLIKRALLVFWPVPLVFFPSAALGGEWRNADAQVAVMG